MNPTLQEIRTAVQDQLDEQYDNSIIDRAANYFQGELFARYRIRSMETSTTVTVQSGATSVAMPGNMQTLLKMIVTGDNPYELEDKYVEYGDFMLKHPNYKNVTATRPWYWTDFSDGIRLSAPADAQYSIEVDFLRRPQRLTGDNSRFEIPYQYEELIVLGTQARVMEREEDYAEAGQERDKLQPLITTFVRNEGRGGFKTGPTVMRTNRRGAHSKNREW